MRIRKERRNKEKGLYNTAPREFIKGDFIGRINLRSRRMYRYYKDSEFNSFEINYSDWSKVISSIFKKVKEDLIKNERGVFLEGIGYFGVVVYPDYRKDLNYFNTFEFRRNDKIHKPYFFPIRKNKKLSYWSMLNTFNRDVITNIYEEADKGKKYRINYAELSALYGIKGK